MMVAMLALLRDARTNLLGGSRLLLLRRVRHEDFVFSTDQFVFFLGLACSLEFALRLSLRATDVQVSTLMPSLLVLAALLLIYYATSIHFGYRRRMIEQSLIALAALLAVMIVGSAYFVGVGLLPHMVEQSPNVDALLRFGRSLGMLIVVALWVVVGHRSRICVYGYLLRPKFSVRAFARSFSTSAFLAFALFVLTVQERRLVSPYFRHHRQCRGSARRR